MSLVPSENRQKRFVYDPETVTDVGIFNPRIHEWRSHFYWDGVRIVGNTATGRATVESLGMNRPVIVEIRKEEVGRGRLPPTFHE